MKILKIFGIVVGIHVFALILIFANPGCSSSSKAPPTPADTVATPAPGIRTADTPLPAAPALPPPPPASAGPGVIFNPDAPALGAAGTGGSRYTPTRPGSAVATTLVTEPVTGVTPTSTYTVKPGDSLWTIAKKHHLTVPQLAAANTLASNANLKPGQKLLIPQGPAGSLPAPVAPASAPAKSGAAAKSPDAAAPRQASSASAGGQLRHRVKPGETLGAIARTYGVKSADIAVANNISDPAKIRADMELIIPGWEAAGGKSGKSGKAGKAGTAAKSPAPAVDAGPNANAEPPPLPPLQPPVIRIDEGPSPIVPAPR